MLSYSLNHSVTTCCGCLRFTCINNGRTPCLPQGPCLCTERRCQPFFAQAEGLMHGKSSVLLSRTESSCNYRIAYQQGFPFRVSVIHGNTCFTEPSSELGIIIFVVSLCMSLITSKVESFPICSLIGSFSSVVSHLFSSFI